MDINKLTIGEAKELASFFQNQLSRSGLSFPIGKYVIVRSRNEGVNFGKLVEADETGCILEECSRLWYHKGKSANWYEGVANTGVSDDTKMSIPTQKIIIENYSITTCSEFAISSIKSHPKS